MAEGQGSGHDSPERDTAWQPSPPPAGDPGDGAPEPATDPGAADPGTSWLPFKMTSPAEDAAQAAAQPAATTPAAPGTPPGQPGSGQPASGTPGQPASGTPSEPAPGTPGQPAPGTPGQPAPGTPGQPAPGTPGQPAQPLGGLSSPWQAQPGTQPTWAAPQQPGTPPTGQAGPGQAGPGQAGQDTQAAPTQSYGTPPQSPYGGPQHTQPLYGPPPGYGAQPPYGTPAYGGQPPYAGQPGGQAYYTGQPTYPGQQPQAGQQPYGQQYYGEQPQQGWQPQPGPGSVPPLPGEMHGALPPGGESHWAPPGSYGQPPVGPPPGRGPMSRALVYIVVALLAAAVGAGAVFALRGSGGAAPSGSVGAQDIPQPKANPGAGAGSGNVSATVARKVDPGLVDITSKVHYQQQVFEGTGMVLSANGLVLTNNHVIKGATQVTAQLVTGNGRRYTAKVLGTDNSQDVALLQLVGASGLQPVTTGDSSKVQYGDTVVALGNAGGNGGLPTVTQGTITGLKRTITASDAGSNTSERLTNMFQTNAPIAEGDSGGALANTAGQVIAMNTAANTQNIGGNGTSQGFSIPIDRALAIARQIAAGHGSSTIQIGQPAFMGIEIASGSSATSSTATSPRRQLQQLQRAAGFSGGGINSSHACLPGQVGSPVPASIAPASSGTLIAGVFCNTPASAAGLLGGDVITAVNGQSVTSPASLTRLILAHYHPGDRVRVSWVSAAGQSHVSSLTLAAGPAK